MVRILSSPVNEKTEGRPLPYRHYQDPLRNRGKNDPIRHRDYFQPTYTTYEYKPYKPSHIGIYGEKQNQHKPRPKPTTPKQTTPKQTQRNKEPKETFDCYRDPKGPDIKTSDLGPDYITKSYEFKEYKPHTLQKREDRKTSYVDPLKSKPAYVDRQVEVYKGDVTYKLNEQNNAAMRNWNYGFVNDTVSARRNINRQENYAVKEPSKPKTEYKEPVESKPKTPVRKEPERKSDVKPVVAAILPIQKASKALTPPPSKKTFTSSYTQHIAPGVKTTTTQTQESKKTAVATQYEAQKSKTMSIQTDTPDLPVIAPVPIPNKTVQTRSEGVQCSEPPKNVKVQSTQWDRPSVRVQDTQTSPVVFTNMPVQQPVLNKPRSPEYGRHETPVYRSAKPRSPSPEIVPLVIATSTTSKRRSPEPIKQSPEQKSRPSRKTLTVTPPTSSSKQVPPKTRTPEPQLPVLNSRWTPSPEVMETAPVFAAANPVTRNELHSPKQISRQDNSEITPTKETPKTTTRNPKVAIPGKTEALPEQSSPSVAKQPTPTRSSIGSFPYPVTRRRLPPEVTACIEAYDCAHWPT